MARFHTTGVTMVYRVRDSATVVLISLLVPVAYALVAASLPTGQKVPLPHTTHWSTLVIDPTKSTGLAVPPGHGNAAAAPNAQ